MVRDTGWTRGVPRGAGWWLVLLLAALPAAAAERTQTFNLNPGWNSIFLEVQPEDVAPDAVFAGLPVASVWTWIPDDTAVQFIQDPAEGLIDRPGWLGWFPRPRPESILTNLSAIHANRPYLVHLEGAAPVELRVTGEPRVRDRGWITDSFNLVGFYVNPALPATFGNYLAPSPAHAGQPIYRLDGSGVWQLIASPFSQQIESGVAYWVYTDGPSDYRGPVEIDLPGGTALEFGGSLSRLRLNLLNRGNATSLSVRQVDGSQVPLTVFRFDTDTGEQSWPDLPEVYSLAAGPDEELQIELGVRRQDFVSVEAEGLLEITNGQGFRRFVAVSAAAALPSVNTLRSARAAARVGAPLPAATPGLEGLWIGDVRVTGVSEAQNGSLTPTPVGANFSFRVLIHVDSSGQLRLLKEVIQMWQEGTMVVDPASGDLVVETPGYHVLVTDDSLIPNFDGASARDGQPVGIRASTAAYDFDGDEQLMNGNFALGGAVTTTLLLPSEFPTNPFRHKFHPDHDNKDLRFIEFSPEAYEVTRNMTFDFATTDPFGRDLPEWGSELMGGTYSETLSGLHRNDIAVEGTFLLRRASARAVLNE
ncbi:MAG: hypothetical protein AAF481_00440 [Acidobacteriota bacterium]